MGSRQRGHVRGIEEKEEKFYDQMGERSWEGRTRMNFEISYFFKKNMGGGFGDLGGERSLGGGRSTVRLQI